MPYEMLDEKPPHATFVETDPVAMATAFEIFFKREYPALGLRVKQCQVCRVYQKPNKETHVTYRVLGEDRQGRAYDQWLHGRLGLHNGRLPPLVQESGESRGSDDFWKPVSIWPEKNMVLHAFPYDPKLPDLRKLVDPVWLKQRIEENLSGFGLSPDWQCRNVVCQKIKYMPGKRCVLRYQVALRNAAGQEREFLFYSKTAENAKGAYVFETLQSICAGTACRSGLLNVPSPIAYLQEARTLWQLAWEGTGLSTKAKAVGWLSLLKPVLMSQIAAMLAALHHVKLPDRTLQRGATTAAMLKNAEGDAAHILEFFPLEQKRLAPLLAALAACQSKLRSPHSETTIHGTFKIAQILYREDQIALVDFDSVARGNPLYDVAEFIASLLYLRISHNLSPALVEENVTLFLAGYFERVPWPCDDRQLGWYVAAFLLGKIHSSLKRGETQALANLHTAFAMIEERLTKVV